MAIEVISATGNENIATVFVAKTQNNKYTEFVESFQPGLPIEKKWVIIVSAMHGCPIRCLMCDAGGIFNGNLSKEDMLAQIDYVVKRRFPDRKIPTKNFKIQFNRMGEPALNDAVLDVLETLPFEYDAPGLTPSVSTIAPEGKDWFFERLLKIKNRYYKNGHFQVQFTIHTTDIKKRNKLIPARKWGFEKISKYGEKFFGDGDKKIALNFALIKGYSIEPATIRKHFDPQKFLIKITPLNPTEKTVNNKLDSGMNPLAKAPAQSLVHEFQSLGFDVIVSIGPLEENQIGSNCGQFLTGVRSQLVNCS